MQSAKHHSLTSPAFPRDSAGPLMLPKAPLHLEPHTMALTLEKQLRMNGRFTSNRGTILYTECYE
ncbi:hypothetical protein E2C01_048332 [Portunus trituberculatus]|uniref:Uncharacterized protein n=1 Tax=Portunus trituberculatus TaxID=210409 RepID=A0A5B7GAF8_PORTR|nr:hypothetical protein [Portunus trituberculatus]